MATKVDLLFAELVIWGRDNLTKREKELIYIFENFQRAYLTQQELRSKKEVSQFYLQQLRKVEDYLEKQNVPVKL